MELREVKEVDTCPECGCTWLTCCNKSNHKAWGYCWECEAEFPLEFAEKYNGKIHKLMAVAGVTDRHSMGARK